MGNILRKSHSNGNVGGPYCILKSVLTAFMLLWVLTGVNIQHTSVLSRIFGDVSSEYFLFPTLFFNPPIVVVI